MGSWRNLAEMEFHLLEWDVGLIWGSLLCIKVISWVEAWECTMGWGQGGCMPVMAGSSVPC